MQFVTVEEAELWCQTQGFSRSDPTIVPITSGTLHSFRSEFPTPGYRLAWFAGWLVATAPGTGDRLLWVKQTGIWPSSENWTLVSRFRLGYGESRPFRDAPAALAPESEIEDLAAFAQIALISGWDFLLYSAGGWFHLFGSHDEFIEYRSTDPGLLDTIREDLKIANVEIVSDRAV